MVSLKAQTCTSNISFSICRCSSLVMSNQCKLPEVSSMFTLCNLHFRCGIILHEKYQGFLIYFWDALKMAGSILTKMLFTKLIIIDIVLSQVRVRIIKTNSTMMRKRVFIFSELLLILIPLIYLSHEN